MAEELASPGRRSRRADLDDDHPRPPGQHDEPGYRRRLPALRPSWALILVAAILGGIGTHLWDDRQQRRRDQATVALLVSPSTAGWSGGGDGTFANLRGDLAVTNLGPRPVQVRGLRAQRGGLLLRSASAPITAERGIASTMPVTLRLVCGEGLPLTLTVQATVTTDDGKRRSKTVEMPTGTAWLDPLDQVCR